MLSAESRFSVSSKRIASDANNQKSGQAQDRENDLVCTNPIRSRLTEAESKPNI